MKIQMSHIFIKEYLETVLNDLTFKEKILIRLGLYNDAIFQKLLRVNENEEREIGIAKNEILRIKNNVVSNIE